MATANPTAALPMFHEYSTFSVKASPIWFVNRMTRIDANPPIINSDGSRQRCPDVVGPNDIRIQEDYELSVDGWHPPILTVNQLIGFPTAVMTISLQTAYRYVRTVTFDQHFSSVFAIMKMTSLLESCTDVIILLNENNVEHSQIDRDNELTQSPYMWSVSNSNVRTFSLMKPATEQGSSRWKGLNYRTHLFSKYALICFSGLREFFIDVFGDAINYRAVKYGIFDQKLFPRWYLPLKLFYNPSREHIVIKVTFGTGLVKRQNPACYRLAAPTLPRYMATNADFMSMDKYLPRNNNCAFPMRQPQPQPMASPFEFVPPRKPKVNNT